MGIDNSMDHTDISGKWKGTIIYGPEYGPQQNKELYFEMKVNQKGNLINAVAKDIGGIGMHEKEAIIKGKFDGKNIDFEKQYPTLHLTSIFGKKTRYKKNKPGAVINYHGTFDKDSKTFSGTWIINSKIKFLFIIPVKLEGSGTWKMKKI